MLITIHLQQSEGEERNWPHDYKRVSQVQVEDGEGQGHGEKTISRLDTARRLTQHDNWIRYEFAYPLFDNAVARTTRVGDVFELPNGDFFMVESSGFDKMKAK